MTDNRDDRNEIENTRNRDNENAKRPARVPVSGEIDILTVRGKEDGYMYRWVTDTGQRISIFKAAWWEFSPTDVVVGTRQVTTEPDAEGRVKNIDNDGVSQYLMRIKEEYYNEDQQLKQDRLDEEESDMRRNLSNHEDGKYGAAEISK